MKFAPAYKKIIKKEYLIVFFTIVIKLFPSIYSLQYSGYLSDEFLHIESGKHLAAGYMAFPPFIALCAFIQNLFGSASVIINRLTVYIAAVLIIIYTAKITLTLGGNIVALLITMVVILFSPAFALSQNLCLPVVFIF